MSAKNYWEHRYGEAADAHSDQNRQISLDFLLAIEQRRGAIFSTLRGARSAVEVGCGTGEFIALVHGRFGLQRSLGFDLSDIAVQKAREAHGDSGVEYIRQDASLPSLLNNFDVALCSNTLEHFKMPWRVLNGMLHMAPKAVVLVPYDQPCTDGYDHEGGAGHVFRFTEHSFEDYRLLDWFLFKSAGWQHSSEGEEPRQLAALVELCP
jgi:ubiquinone/menaquinone biosynthesis C-methylase UbiE